MHTIAAASETLPVWFEAARHAVDVFKPKQLFQQLSWIEDNLKVNVFVCR